jgi:hypothetical protein|tara:strand:- start:1171 stop:1728 length:558 start_codon:yes stop_codon:yes gene_type:complete
MRKFTLLILGVLFISGLNAQTIDKLDTKNGFKDFTLGDSYTKWQSQTKFEGSWDDGTKAYLYTGSCCNKVFSYAIDKIVLRFSANKLVGIYITTEKFQKGYAESGIYTKWRTDDFESIKSSFSYLFGKPTSVDAPENSGEITHLWVGKKVLLTSKYEYMGVQNGDRQLINILDLQFLNKGIEDGF